MDGGGKSRRAADPAALGGMVSGSGLVALSRRSAFVRPVRLPDLARDEAQRILQVQAPQLFPLPPDDLACSFVWTDDVSPEGRLAIGLAARSETVRTAQAAAAQVGISVDRLLPVALGAPLVAQALDLRDGAVVTEDVEGLCIDIVADGSLRYSRVVPRPHDSEGIEAEVCRTFSIAKTPCGTIVAAGGLVFDGAHHTTPLSPLELLSHPPASLTGVSLEDRVEAEARVKRRQGSKVRLAMLASVAALAAVLLVGFDHGDAALQASQTTKTRKAAQARMDDLKSALYARMAAKQKALDTLGRALAPPQPFSDVLSVVSEAMPEGVWLTGVSLERGRPLQFRGTALNSALVSTLVDRMEAGDRFRDVKLLFANNAAIEGRQVVQFSITAHSIGNLPLVEKKKKGTRP